MASYRANVEIGIANTVIAWESGLGPVDSETFGRELARLSRQGALGTGAQAGSNMKELNKAWQKGRSAVFGQPMFKAYAEQIKGQFTNSNLGKRDAVGEAAALEAYGNLVLKQKMTPVQAYQQTMGSRGTAKVDPRKRLAELEAKARQ